MLTGLQCWILKKFFPGSTQEPAPGVYTETAKAQQLLGKLLDHVAGKTVIDFGCGEGLEAIEFARHGAAQVVGVDIREEILKIARKNAESAGLADRCHFT